MEFNTPATGKLREQRKKILLKPIRASSSLRRAGMNEEKKNT
jgi:hypothetical protein